MVNLRNLYVSLMELVDIGDEVSKLERADTRLSRSCLTRRGLGSLLGASLMPLTTILKHLSSPQVVVALTVVVGELEIRRGIVIGLIHCVCYITRSFISEV